MSGRMSNRDRIAQAALEAEEARKQKEKAAASRAAKPAATRKKSAASAPTGKLRAVWAVCDQTGATVETFAYPKEAEARAEAERRMEETGKTHFVKPDKVPAD